MPHRHAVRSLSLLLLLAAPTAVLAQEAPGATQTEAPAAPESAPSAPSPEAAPPAAAPESTASAEAPAAEPPAEDTTLYKVVLKDGQELRGRLVRRDEASLELALVGGGVLTIPAASVRSVSEETRARVSAEGELSFADPNRTRYFYGPSAMMLRQGEVYFSQKELFFSSLAVGVTDHISVLVGSIVPLWFTGTNGINFIFGAKAGLPVMDNLHVAAGAESLMLPGFGSPGASGTLVGLAFGTVTYGTRDAHVSLSGGKPFVLTAGSSIPNDMMVMTVSGNLRVAKNVALMTENWIVPVFSQASAGTAHALGVRLMSEHIAVDLGGVFLSMWTRSGVSSALSFPMPWLDFTYNFG